MDPTPSSDEQRTIAEDVRTLHRLGYAQELVRCLSGFSNFAISLSIICIVAGGLTSFHLGFGAVGGAAIGLGWPLMGLLSLAAAATMGHLASAFPTAGGLYHWAAILGGRGWGWMTAWFNLAGLVTVLAAINVGTFQFAAAALGSDAARSTLVQLTVVAAITASQAVINHLGIRVTRVLTDFSGYWILLVATSLTVALLVYAPTWDFGRLVTFDNFSGLPAENPVWPRTESLALLFALSMLLPAYTITGFDASAHAAEETVGAAEEVPRAIIRSVLVSGVFGWIMLSAAVLAMPDPATAAQQGDRTFVHTLSAVCPRPLAGGLLLGCVLAQYLCGLATVTSASRMAFAFARDGGLPLSTRLRKVSPRFRTPAAAIWTVAAASVLFTVYSPVYSTITAVCVILLYISYVLPTVLGLVAYGRSWTEHGPWQLGKWYRPVAVVCVAACVGLIVIGMQPPNEKSVYVVAGITLLLLIVWLARARRTFPGPPHGVLTRQQQAAIAAAEAAVHEAAVDEAAPKQP